ncbi:FadR/GntR family transcriptional regulator [Dermacoccus barathri]|uniref:FCD domain-containing protein n=1 Tax=Dermacoccus barathri TaxID=322601 RepID=A0ABN2BG94_9MICO
MPNKPKAFDIVRAHIEERILDGSLDIGDTLAAERELATEFGVSRGAVRETIRALEAQGVVESSVGAGRAGGTRIIRARTRALTRLLRLHVALAGGRLREVVELRVALERSSATLAAASVTPDALEAMRALLAEMRGEGVDIETFNRLDTDFHVAIARAADNTLVTDLTIAVRESLRAPILVAEQGLSSGEYADFRGMLCEQHEGIFAALEAGDGEDAAQRIETHIRAAYSALPVLTAAPE